MSDSDDPFPFISLRSRDIPRYTSNTRNQNNQPSTSTPINNRDTSIQRMRSSIHETTNFIRHLSNQVDQNISVQHSHTLFPNLDNSSVIMNRNPTIYNKEIAELMSLNIPKFELNTCTNPSLQLRSFIKSCENVLSLFPEDDNDSIEEFFKLIKFRLGYDVLERITVDKFENLRDLEMHLRCICHLKLNKGKLIGEIRNEKQNYNEDVSHFVERLRKLIAQGRSEYTNDKDFEREAIHTLKNSVKNELISIKLMDSTTNKFEELAEIAINRDSELHQRNHNISKSESKASQELVNELMQRIRNLELSQPAKVQHIREGQRFTSKSPNKHGNLFRPQTKYNSYCNYCKRPGHNINECRNKNQNPKQYSYSRKPEYFNNQTRNYPPQNSNHNSRSQPIPNHYRNHLNNNHNFNFRSNSPKRQYYKPRNNSPNERNYRNENDSVITCLRCNQPGHKSNNCYELICRLCKQIGHIHTQCPQNRRVNFTNCNQASEYVQNNNEDLGNE